MDGIELIKKATVLVVDDTPINLALIERACLRRLQSKNC